MPKIDTAYLTQEKSTPKAHTIPQVPLIPQESHYCGPAALATVLQFHGFQVSQKQAADMVYTPGRKGTLQHDILTALRRQGLLAIPVNTLEDVILEIAADHPVILFQNLGYQWKPFWHYSVVTGYDLDKKTFHLHSGGEKIKTQAFRTIAATWKRGGFWGYIGVPPTSYPPTASETEILFAAAGLETAKKLTAAHQAYQTILKKHPKSYNALFGLANVAAAENRFTDAVPLYRRALAINPDAGYIRNNLAFSLQQLNQMEAACALLTVPDFYAMSIEERTVLTKTRGELCP